MRGKELDTDHNLLLIAHSPVESHDTLLKLPKALSVAYRPGPNSIVAVKADAPTLGLLSETPASAACLFKPHDVALGVLFGDEAGDTAH